MIELKFAENLRALRKSKKMTQEKLAKLLCVSKQSISSWERKTREPSFEMLAKICELFDETFENILT